MEKKVEKKSIVIVIDKELKDEVEELCRLIGASLNSFVISAIREKIQNIRKVLKYEKIQNQG